MNGVITTGTITPAAPASGSTFNLTNYQSTVVLPNAIVSAAAALGNSAITGTATLKVDATGATPASVAAPTITIDAPIPSPVPPTGLSLVLPSTPGTVGPFTASGGAITLTVDPAIALTLVVSGSDLSLTCTPYPNNSAATGIVSSPPSGAKASPVIAVANGGSTTTTTTEGATTSTVGSTTTTAPPQMLTGPYELYCPGTPVGTVVLNDAVTSATLSPAQPSAGQAFSVTGYQTVVNLPASLASAAAAVGGPSLMGSATAQIDASGATPATTPEGPLNFNVPFPSPIPDSGVSLSLPSTPATVPGFTATTGNITIQEDSSASLSLTVAGNALALTCTAYPNDSVPISGITTVVPTNAPIAPVIASAASTSITTTTTTTTTMPSTTTTTTGAITTTTGGTTTTATAGAATTTSTTAPTTTTSAPSRATSTTSSTSTTSKKPSTSSASGTSSPSARAVTAASGSLAFTGPGPGLETATIIGAALMLLGLLMLLLADIPRRVRHQFAYVVPRRGKDRRGGGTGTAAVSNAGRVTQSGGPSHFAAGWYVDPFAAHQERLFKQGIATPVVRDDGVGSYDEPPE